MVFGIEEQIRFLLWTIVAGMMCGLFYDILRARRKLLDLGNICVNIEDVIFCILTGVIFLFITFYLNSGIIRVSGFFAIILGEVLYFIILRNRMRNFLVFIANTLVKCFILILKFIIFPLRLVITAIKKPVYIVVLVINDCFRNVRIKFKKFDEYLKRQVKIIGFFVRKKGKKH